MSFPHVEAPRIANASTTFRNVGNGTLEISTIYLEGSAPEIGFTDGFVIRLATQLDLDWTVDASGHILSGDPPLTLEPNEGLQVDLEYSPTGPVPGCDPAACGFLVIESNDRDAADRVLRIPITLQSETGRVEVNPTRIQFPQPTIGATYNETFQIRNVGQGTLTIASVAPREIVPGLSVTLQGTPLPLSPNTATTVEVSYRPDTTDELNTSILVNSDDPSNGTVIVQVTSGAGGLPTIEVDPTSIDFGDVAAGTTEEALFDVRNSGEGGACVASDPGRGGAFIAAVQLLASDNRR